MKGIGTKTIVTNNLILRKIKVSDYELAYKNWTSDSLVTRYVTWDYHQSIEDTKNYFQYKENRYLNDNYCYDWIIILKESNEPIGEIETVRVSTRDQSVEIGYCLGSKFWNRGYGSEALKAVINYLFLEAEVDKIIACHISTNPTSGKVMKKCGMKYDGTLVGYLIDKNTNRRENKVYYSIDRKNI